MRWRIPLSLTVVAFVFAGCSDSTQVVEPPGGVFPTLSIVAGQDQFAHPGEELAEPLVVQAVEMFDGKEKPVAGVVVNFVVTAGDGSVFAGAASTNQEGYAADYLTLGPEYGLNTVEVRSVDANGQKHVWGTFTARAKEDATPPEIDGIWFCAPDPNYPFPVPDENCDPRRDSFFPGDEYLVVVQATDPYDPVTSLAGLYCSYPAWIDGQNTYVTAIECYEEDPFFFGVTPVQVVPAEYKGGEVISVSVSVTDWDDNTVNGEGQLVVSKPK